MEVKRGKWIKVGKILPMAYASSFKYIELF